jgi:molybdenum cofactor guanylyltransferase
MPHAHDPQGLQPLGFGTSCGGVVVCGGRSSRMGRPKLSLPFGDELLLQRVVRILKQVVDPIVVVAARDQELPRLPSDVTILRDETPDLGPLAGMWAGLAALVERGLEAGYVSGCDTPLITPEFVRTVIGSLGGHELAVPKDGEFYHPLAGVYRTSLAPRIRALLDAGRLRPLFLIEESDARKIEPGELRRVDPELDSLRNANTADEYEALLTRAAGS